MSQLRQPSALKQVCALKCISLLPTYTLIQSENLLLPSSVLDYLRHVWIKEKLFCNETLYDSDSDDDDDNERSIILDSDEPVNSKVTTIQ